MKTSFYKVSKKGMCGAHISTILKKDNILPLCPLVSGSKLFFSGADIFLLQCFNSILLFKIEGYRVLILFDNHISLVAYLSVIDFNNLMVHILRWLLI